MIVDFLAVAPWTFFWLLSSFSWIFSHHFHPLESVMPLSGHWGIWVNRLFKRLLLDLSSLSLYTHTHMCIRAFTWLTDILLSPSSGLPNLCRMAGNWDSSRQVTKNPKATSFCRKVLFLIHLVQFQTFSLRSAVKCAFQTFQVKGSLAIVYSPSCLNSCYKIPILGLSLIHIHIQL